MTKQIRENAQDAIISAAVHAALAAEERGDTEDAEAIRVLATRLAKQYGFADVPGLPATYDFI